MNNKFFRMFGIIIIGLNAIIFSVFSLYLLNMHNYNIVLMFFILPILILNIVFSLNVYFRMNKTYEDIFLSYRRNKDLNDLILKNSPIGIIIVDRSGIIKFVNPATGNILGSTKTIGLNILEFDTVKNSKMYDGILKALNGESTEIKNEKYTSFTTKILKHLNIYIYPITDYNKGKADNVIIMIHDATEAFNLITKIENTYLSGLEALASLVDAKDSYTGEHSKNVSQYVSIICENINCDIKKGRDEVKIAATFHDLGKIGIPDSILNKAGKLAKDEYEIMKTHPVIGADVIKKIDEFNQVSNIIRHHHERWDGTGYPDGLKGTEIPFGSQIISIADTYDAIVSDRIYRKSRGKDEAIKILIEEKGKQFNPELVDVFIKSIDLIK